MTTRPGTDPKVLAAFDMMIAAVAGVERKGVTMPYVSINGNMYAMISKADVIGLRLSGDDLTAFLAAYNAKPFETIPGLANKDYAAVPAALLDDRKTLQSWFRLSYAHASRLTPKATVR
jgi:TfoX/Sxy family transcriptional regulator of competence genes